MFYNRGDAVLRDFVRSSPFRCSSSRPRGSVPTSLPCLQQLTFCSLAEGSYAYQRSPGLPLSTNSIGILSRPINQAMRLPPNATAGTGAVKIIMPLPNRRFVVNSMSSTE